MSTQSEREEIVRIVTEHGQLPLRELARLLGRRTRSVGLDVETLRRSGRIVVLRPGGGYREGARIILALEAPYAC